MAMDIREITRRPRERSIMKRSDHPRYVKDGTVPQSIGKGRALMHNHIRHSLDMPSGENGFRAWMDDRRLLGFKRCGCGWSGLPHYSATPDYRCEPRSRLSAMIHPLGMG
jgi:hypothetical protein